MIPEEEEYQNVISREPDLVLTELSGDQKSLIRKPRYNTLIRIIHENEPLTVSDLAEKYAEIATEEANSESTVYRMIKELEKLDLVMESGRRVIEGKIWSKNLYSLVARYIVFDEPEVAWGEENGFEKFQELVKIHEIVYPEKKVDKKALFQWQLYFQELVDGDKRKLIESDDPGILEIISVWSPYEFSDLIEYTGIYSVLIHDKDFQKKLLACFKDIPPSERKKRDYYEDEVLIKAGNGHQDIIRNRSSILCVLDASDKRVNYFRKPSYRPITRALYNRPMTVEEIVKAYNDYTNETRKTSTIYKYLKKMKDNGIVEEMGQRVYHDRKAVQRIYGLKARIFHFLADEDRNFTSKKHAWLVDSSIKALHYLHPDLPPADREKMRVLGVETTNCNREGMKRLDRPENLEARDIFLEYGREDFYLVITTYLDYNFYLNRDNIYEWVMSCFSGN